jgi:hypothetical protein
MDTGSGPSRKVLKGTVSLKTSVKAVGARTVMVGVGVLVGTVVAVDVLVTVGVLVALNLAMAVAVCACASIALAVANIASTGSLSLLSSLRKAGISHANDKATIITNAANGILFRYAFIFSSLFRSEEST